MSATRPDLLRVLIHLIGYTDTAAKLGRLVAFQQLPFSALEVFLNDMRYINPRFTYLLTYLLLNTCIPVI